MMTEDIHYCSDIDGPCSLVHDLTAEVNELKKAGELLYASVNRSNWLAPLDRQAVREWDKAVGTTKGLLEGGQG